MVRLDTLCIFFLYIIVVVKMQSGHHFTQEVNGGPRGVRTHDLPVKSRTLYLAKLWARGAGHYGLAYKAYRWRRRSRTGRGHDGGGEMGVR